MQKFQRISFLILIELGQFQSFLYEFTYTISKGLLFICLFAQVSKDFFLIFSCTSFKYFFFEYLICTSFKVSSVKNNHFEIKFSSFHLLCILSSFKILMQSVATDFTTWFCGCYHTAVAKKIHPLIT